MKKNVLFSLAAILACLAVIVSCASMDNGGGTDWGSVKMSVSLPDSNKSGNRMSATSDETFTSVVFAVPASVESVVADTDLSEAFDRQIMDETSSTVTLKVPLNESMRLAVKIVDSTVTLDQALSADADMYGLSDAFTVDADTTSKTVTINTSSTEIALTGVWTFVDGDGATGLIKDSSSSTRSPHLLSHDCGLDVCADSDNGLYAIWPEFASGSVLNIRVAKWDGSSTWSFVDGDGASGINAYSNQAANYPCMLTYSNRVYAIWEENSSTYNTTQIRAARYKKDESGNDAWPIVEGGNNYVVNKDPSQEAIRPEAVVFNNKLYITWTEMNGSGAAVVRVGEYDNDGAQNFELIDGGTDNGVNYDSTSGSNSPHMAVFEDTLFITWAEAHPTSGYSQIRIAKWDGSSSWIAVAGDAAAGINKNIGSNAGRPRLIYIEGSGLYVTWDEEHPSDGNQIRVAKWDGDDNWNLIDGDGEYGLNHDSSKTALLPHPVEYNSKLYISWYEAESFGMGGQVRIIEYDGSDWNFVDGDGTVGINKNSAKEAFSPALTVHDSKLFAAWTEGDSTGYQIRVAVAETE